MYLSWQFIPIAVFVIAKIVNKESFGWGSLLVIGLFLAPWEILLIGLGIAILWLIGWKFWDSYSFAKTAARESNKSNPIIVKKQKPRHLQ